MIPDASLAQVAVSGFARRWRREPSHVACAPGRVNLIGEHTDYNDGPVLPIAIERHVVIGMARAERGSTVTRLYASAFDEEVAVDLEALATAAVPVWAKYPIGVMQLLAQSGFVTGALDLFIDSDVPIGAGLSSSAALEVATATLVEALAGRTLGSIEKARVCRRAESEIVGVPCGIMDQVASACGRRDHAILLDCRFERIEYVAIPDGPVAFLVTDTGVRRELGRVEYAKRRAECARAAELLRVRSLRDVTIDLLDAARERLDTVLFRRARHVVTEIARTWEAADALRRGDWPALGRSMDASHDSLRDDFEVSSVELDALVDVARAIGRAGGVFGSRLTGAGFGGCTVTLVEKVHADEILATMREEYRTRLGREAAGFVARPVDGARVLVSS